MDLHTKKIMKLIEITKKYLQCLKLALTETYTHVGLVQK